MLTNFASKPDRITVTPLPNHKLLITVNENIRQVESVQSSGEDGVEVSEQWAAEQYSIIVPHLPGIAERADREYEAWLVKAKNQPIPEVSEQQRIDELESAVLELASILGGE